GRQREDREAKRDGSDAGPGAQDRAVEQAVRMLVLVPAIVIVAVGGRVPGRGGFPVGLRVLARNASGGRAKGAHEGTLAPTASGASLGRVFGRCPWPSPTASRT